MKEFSLAGKRVAVVGMARSGLSAAKLVRQSGASVLASDMKPAEQLLDSVRELNSQGIETETGGHSRLIEERFDLIVLSPGVAPSTDMITIWQRKGAIVWSELALAARFCQNRWIGVTGSNGKTTTVHLIAAALRRAGFNAIMAGNIGQAWSAYLPAPTDVVFVVEVSSFQLEYAEHLHPPVAVLLNLYENHLDRHGTMEVYADLKARLFRNQRSADVAVINGEDEWVTRLSSEFRARPVRFGRNPKCDFWSTPDMLFCRVDDNEQVLLERRELPLMGYHNELNALAAAAAAIHFGAPVDAVRLALKEAKAVEHRIEFVSEKNGVRFYNDSKSTNMVATMTALDAFEGNVILLFGGRPKKESFAPLADRVLRPLKRIIAFGEAVPKVQAEVSGDISLECVDNLEHALSTALSFAKPGDVVLLSPGCTSFDQFRDYEERGRVFKSLVNNL